MDLQSAGRRGPISGLVATRLNTLMRLVALAGAMSIASVIPGNAQTPAQAPGLTLAQAIERALASNPTIAATRLQRPVDVAGIGVARERPNPEIAFEASKETPRQAFGGTLPIELGGKRRARIDVATATVAVSEAELARVINEVRNDVRRSYFDVLVADQRVSLAQELRALATRARDAARARVDAGDAPQVDLTQASLALASTENDVAGATGEAAAARAELNALLGQPAETPVTLSDQLGASALMPLTEAMSLATQANTELQALDRRIQAQQARVALAKANRTPDASAGATFTADAEPEFQYGWRLTGAITLPIFTTHRAGVLVEEAELARLQGERQAVTGRMSGAIAAAFARAGSARDQVNRYQNDIVPLLLQAEQQAQVSYTAGQTGLVALVQALQTSRAERERGLQAMQDFQHALADLERAIGAPLR